VEENATFLAHIQSPIGLLEITATGEALNGLVFVDEALTHIEPDGALLKEAAAQLKAYFAGKLRSFDLPLTVQGTLFRQRVWQALQQIPFGKTASYLDVARAVGNPKAVRAVGGANHHNPISIIIPCHRVIGANGKLTGYGGGLWRKEWLLRHEGSWPQERQTFANL